VANLGLACTAGLIGDGAGGGASSGQPGPGAAGGTGTDPGPGPGGTPVGPPPIAPPAASAVEMACKTRDPGPAPIRRLTRWEYDNTVRDLLGDTTHPASAFPPDERGAGFTNDALALSVSPLHAQNYLDAAEKIVGRAAADLGKLVPCDPARGDAACGAKFIETWGKRAWRRPLDATEKTELGKVFTAGMSSEGFAVGIQMVMQVMLQAPQFLYRVETGAGAAAAGMVKLSPWEMASRLSYLFWGSMPDNDLFLAAEGSKLGTREEIAAQARRLMADPRARPMVALFHEQWLELDKIDDVEKDRTLFAGFDPVVLRPLFRKEADLTLEAVVWQGDGTVASLLTAPFSFMNARLATHYGIKGPAGDAFERVMLDPAQRGGFLTEAGFLAAHALANQTDPVRRGKFVREQLFCTILPPPPDNVEVRPPDLDPKLTTRERFARHSQDPLCAGCHQLMDPIGLGFESYDAVGKFRATENGKPVDASGTITGTDIDGGFVGAVELGKKLAGSAQVRACVVKQWFRFGYGRSETPQDLCSMETLKAMFAGGKNDVRELLVALTQTDAFMFRRAGGAP
jgi:hypothetical protein